MKEKYYYHLTDKESATKILKEGLKPMVGDNSKLVNEDRPTVYLCRRKDLPYWKILLGKEVVLQIQDADIPAEECNYGDYNEYLCYNEIPADKIKRVYIKLEHEKAMKDLCLSYLAAFSRCTEIAARHYNYPNSDYGPDLEVLLNSSLVGARNLDYSVLTKKEIKEELKYHGESGCYTFVDTYLDEDTRMYEQLIKYPEDEFSEKRAKLHRYIKKTFKGCLNVDTGGWTG